MVIPEEIRGELLAHARAEAPNEACGLVLFRDGVAERYIPGENSLASPYRLLNSSVSPVVSISGCH